jgi:hypothetical protein
MHSSTDRVAALIAWLPIVRVGNLVKDGAKRRRLRRSSILDKIANTNRNAVQAIKAAFWAVLHLSISDSRQGASHLTQP